MTKKYDLWLAHYTDAKQRQCGMWQYTSKGRVSGINGNVDMNNSYYNYPALIRALGLNGY